MYGIYMVNKNHKPQGKIMKQCKWWDWWDAALVDAKLEHDLPDTSTTELKLCNKCERCENESEAAYDKYHNQGVVK